MTFFSNNNCICLFFPIWFVLSTYQPILWMGSLLHRWHENLTSFPAQYKDKVLRRRVGWRKGGWYIIVLHNVSRFQFHFGIDDPNLSVNLSHVFRCTGCIRLFRLEAKALPKKGVDFWSRTGLCGSLRAWKLTSRSQIRNDFSVFGMEVEVVDVEGARSIHPHHGFCDLRAVPEVAMGTTVNHLQHWHRASRRFVGRHVFSNVFTCIQKYCKRCQSFIHQVCFSATEIQHSLRSARMYE